MSKAEAPELPIGERIREARKSREMTIAAVADALGIDPRTVAGWQAGRSRPSYERLALLAALLDKPIGFFLGEDTQNGKAADHSSPSGVDGLTTTGG